MKQYENKEWLQKKYWDEGLGMHKVGKLLGVTTEVIGYWMRKFRIKRRSRSEAHLIKLPRKLYHNKDWLHKQYLDKKLSTCQISKICDTAPQVITYWMEKFNIPVRNPKEAARRGENHPSWKGGRCVKSDGYIFIYTPRHPNKNKDNYVYEHRLVMEKHIGRYLHPWEMIHHIDGIRANNRIKNLELLPGRGQHNTKVQEVYKENLFLKEQLANFLSIKT